MLSNFDSKIRNAIAATRQAFERPAVLISIGLAFLLYILTRFALLESLATNIDNVYFGFDYFTLPRCGLAARFGTDLWTAPQTYTQYGPWATLWGSHPALCVVLGIPLSYLPPWTGYHLSNAFYLLMHLAIILAFGRLLPLQESSNYWKRSRTLDYVVFASLGFFYPWYVMYHQAQYHAISVLALFLILLSPKWINHGFIISALSKPFLGPAALVLIVRRQWKRIFWIGLIAGIGYFLAFFLTYQVNEGLHFGFNNNLEKFFGTAGTGSKYSVFRWNQLVSLSAFLDELVPHVPGVLPSSIHYPFRLALGALTVIGASFLLLRKPIELAIALSAMWYFIYYGHGHEYHRTLLVPFLAYLYVRRGTRYRNPWFACLVILSALPTTYGIIRHFYGFPQDGAQNTEMLARAPFWYYLFLAHKPLTELSLVVTIFIQELRKVQKVEGASSDVNALPKAT